MSKHLFLDKLTSAGYGATNTEKRQLHSLLSDLYDALEASEAPIEEKVDALKIVQRYAVDGVIPGRRELHPTPKEWKQFRLGVYPYGTNLRVKRTAPLQGSTAKYLGKEGIFSYVSSGKVFIDFHDDKLNRGPLFSPDDLEAKF